MPVNYRYLFDIVRVKSGFRASFMDRKSEALQAAITEAKEKNRELIPWPKNALRHSAISYALVKSEDISKTATAAGNTPTVITKHYDALAFPNETKEFYNIKPEKTTETVVSNTPKDITSHSTVLAEDDVDVEVPDANDPLNYDVDGEIIPAVVELPETLDPVDYNNFREIVPTIAKERKRKFGTTTLPVV